MTEQPSVPTQPTVPVQPPARPVARQSAPPPNEAPHAADIARMKAFLWIQILFLLASPLTGGFHFAMWSMLDTSLLLLSIGITNLAFVVESRASRRLIFQVAATIYIAGVIDMAINVLMSGVLGWRPGMKAMLVG